MDWWCPAASVPADMEGKMAAIRYARENGLPFLGLCLGMQMAVIEFARHKLGLPDGQYHRNGPRYARSRHRPDGGSEP